MSMQISGNYGHSQTSYAEQVKEKQDAQRVEKAKEASQETEAKGSGKLSEPQDEYISSERSGKKPAGLYRVGHDGNGNRKIFFDDPNKAGRADGQEQPKADEDSLKPDADSKESKVSGDHPEKPVEKCVTDTDKVDREIKKLAEKKQQLEQQIRAASGDEKKIRELKKKLAQAENELSQKDNDTYRRQNASVSNDY